ncbi:MAG: hypothetical protein JNL98_15855 [Bryobacterales bacterium]|nr:hypothetical protein [Bryobacterales bacterium]
MPAVAIYYVCLLGVLPAIAWAVWVGVVMTLVHQQTLGGMARLALRSFLSIGTPWFPAVVLLLMAMTGAWVVAGVLPSIRSYGYVATAIFGLASILYAMAVMPGRDAWAYVLMMPALAASIGSAMLAMRTWL